MKYYIAENGQQAGPFEPSELLLHGLTVNSLVWCEGMPNWTSASQVPELMALLGGQPLPPGGVDMQMPPVGLPTELPETPPFGGGQQPQQPTTYGQTTTNQPYAPPQYGPSTTNRPNQQGMPKTWLTECVIVTAVSALCCCNPVGLITGIYSIFKANSAKNKYMSGDTITSASDAATAKKWMIITIVIMVVWAIIQVFRALNDETFLQQIQEATTGGGSLPLPGFGK